MADLPIDVCITPRVPPQPSPPIQDPLLTLDEAHSKIKQNTENLLLLQRQLKLIEKLTKQVKLRIMEYEVEAKHLQHHSCKSHLPIHINTLPAEILSLIFTFCCGNVLPVDNDITCFTFDQLPWTLSWVCANWRLIAHGTSKLWSVIPGPLKPFASQHDDRELKILEAVCDRSGTSLLRVTLAISESYASIQSTMYRYVAQLLPRIEVLTFRLVEGYDTYTSFWGENIFWFPSEVELSSLRSLSLQEWSYRDDSRHPHHSQNIARFFQKMPRLETMTVQVPQKLEWTNSSNLGLFWRQLTAVTLQNIYDDDNLHLARHIILCAEQLISLHVSDIEISLLAHNPQDVDQKRITHHKLQFLHLHYSRRRDGYGVRSTARAEDFFNTIDLPALTTLSFRHPDPFVSTVLTDFLERSNCSLVEFEFPAVDSFKSVLEHCPNIRVIVLDGCVTDDDLEILTRADDGHWLVPHLEKLTLNRPRIRNANSLVNLIQTRAQEHDVCNLRRLDMTTALFDPPDWLTRQRDDHTRTIGDECSSHLKAVVQAQCGYELVNNSLVMENLALLCQDLEVLEHHDEVTASFLGTTSVREDVIRIYGYLDQVEDLQNLYPVAFKLKFRYKEALRLLTHNPWVFDSLPSDWIHIPSWVCDPLSYTAPCKPTA